MLTGFPPQNWMRLIIVKTSNHVQNNDIVNETSTSKYSSERTGKSNFRDELGNVNLAAVFKNVKDKYIKPKEICEEKEIPD